MARPVAKQTSSAKAKPAAKTTAKAKPDPKPVATEPVAKKTVPAAKQAAPDAKQAAPAAKAPTAKKKAAPAAKAPTAKQAAPAAKAPTAKQAAPAAKAPAANTAPSSSRTRAPAASAAVAPPAPPPARFTFTAVPIVRDAAGLTPLLRTQLVVDAQVRTGRTTTPDRIPTSYFSPGVVRWRVAERGKPVFDVVHDTAFFPDSAEPVGLERIAGHWQATGRGSDRGRALDLPRLAWELMRDWPGRRLALDAEPKPGAKVAPLPPTPDAPWPPDATFV